MNKLKVLRVGMTYPRDLTPGIGLHMFYHSLYSDYEEMIITVKRKGIMPENRQNVKVIEIENKNPELGKYNQSKWKRFVLFLNKIKSQSFFLNKSKEYIDDFQPDIVHVYSPIPILFGIYAKKKYKSKIVMSLHGSDVYRMSKVKKLAKILEIPDAIVVVSENMESILPKVKLKQPIQYIGNGVDLETFRNKHSLRKNQFIHVANLRWQKGQQYLLHGFAAFLHEHSEYQLLVIGEGTERENLEKLCMELNITSNVHFVGTQGRQYIVDRLNESKAFVLSSVTEGFPKVIIESMATGTPVISTDVGNIKNVVKDSGIIIEPQNSEEIKEAMQQIISNQDDWEKMSENGEKIAAQFDWRNHVMKLMLVYDKILEG